MTRINPFVVVRSKGFVYEVLGDTPTPALIDAASDGKPHDAYQHPETGFWRLAMTVRPAGDRVPAGLRGPRAGVPGRPGC